MSFKVSEICNVFFNLEEKYNLNFQEIQGCYPWQLIRMYLYYDISRRTNTFGAPQQQSLTVFDKIKSFYPFLKNSVLYNPLSGNDEKDILIFDHPRKVIFNGEYRDIYSYFLVDFLKDSYSFEIMEAPYLNKHFTNKRDYVKYTGKILQISEGLFKTSIRLSVTKSSYGWYSANDVIWVEYIGSTNFVEEDIVTVYGEITGTHSYTSIAGWKITIPSMDADTIE